MVDIISARCFGCGNVIKVPAALGGKKARCPQCTNTISIPMSANDTQYNDIISDADLPEVARDGEVPVAEEGDAPFPGVGKEPGTEDPPELKRRGGTSVRGRASGSGGSLPRVTASIPSPQRGGTQQRKGGPRPAAPRSNTGMFVGIALGVLALIILAVVVSNNSSKEKGPHKLPPKEKEREATTKEKAPPPPQYAPDEQALVTRLMDYTGAVNRGDVVHMMKFFAYDPEEERKYRIRATELVEKKTVYENVKVTSVGGGSITFSYGAGSTKTIAWKKEGDIWMIAELPSP
jgi:hypothetical protein